MCLLLLSVFSSQRVSIQMNPITRGHPLQWSESKKESRAIEAKRSVSIFGDFLSRFPILVRIVELV
ncbi:hypothetical protein PENTCL1PPCAC_548 [Pristionchus entomophagus]|uniref:Uncharacterized protein n=1 Tax=Pristionchus entomophagus TaxID=358040 RepID=A0AAV5SCI4_9BILA|nr:hypothetical protein PENTCL1PPCAC_548 [Pristionchus entomophagus]